MGKRLWFFLIMVLTLGLLVSACGAGELAKDLTPIPTLAPGETPALLDALAEGAPATEEATEAATEDATEDPTEDATEDAAGDAAGEAGADGMGDAAAGAALFGQCAGCHGAQDGAGPALTGMGERAATRVEGLSAVEYLHESIVDPSAHVVEGFGDIMPKQYGDQFSEDDIANLIAYMLEQ